MPDAPVLSALAPLLSEKAILLSEAHARSLVARAAQGFRSEAPESQDLPDAPKMQRFTFSADGARLTGTVEPHASQIVVAVIPVIGILTKYATDYDGWAGLCACYERMEELAIALADPSIKAIVFDIDSPGGFVNGSVEFADAVAEANKIKPCVAIIRGLCCSGAYWLASQCGQIISRREAEVGNIGVYSVAADLTKYFADWGVSLTLIASGEFKGLGADGKVSEALISESRRMVTGLYQQFTAAVAIGRKLDPAAVSPLADGRAYLGPEAQKLGLVDEIASSFDAAIQAVVGAAAPGKGDTMSQIATPPNASLAGAPPQAAAPAPRSQEEKKDTEATAADSISSVLQATLDSANAHRDQVRKALDACTSFSGDMSDSDKTLAGQVVSALEAAEDESGRCVDAYEEMLGGDDEDEPNGEEQDPQEDDQDKAARKAAREKKRAARAKKAAAAPAASAAFTAQDYITAFGDIGARWFIEGKSFAAATAETLTKLKADHTTEVTGLKASNADLTTKLDSMDRGNEAASFSATDEDKEKLGDKKSKLRNSRPHVATMAGSLKLPTNASK